MQKTHPQARQLVGRDVTRYMLAGRATVTFVNRQTGNRFTFKMIITRSDPPGHPSIWFVEVLTGPDPHRDYQYLACVNPRSPPMPRATARSPGCGRVSRKAPCRRLSRSGTQASVAAVAAS